MPSPAIDRCVVLFTKPAVPGRVKTRLIGRLTAEQAAELHEAFVADMVEALAPGAFERRVAWALEPGEEVPAAPPLPGLRQRGDDLGERLFRGLSEGTEGYGSVAAVGSDHPEIGREEIESAFEILESGVADVVFGPVADGGYYLVALRRSALQRRLFEEIDWSTERVLEQSLARAAELGLSTRLLGLGSDVDRPEDLERLRARLAVEPELARHTAALLGRWEEGRA